MIKEEIGKNEELIKNNISKHRDEIVLLLIEKTNIISDFMRSQFELNKNQNDLAELTLKAFTELDEKNEILKKQVDILHKEIELLQKELDQLKGQGK